MLPIFTPPYTCLGVALGPRRETPTSASCPAMPRLSSIWRRRELSRKAAPLYRDEVDITLPSFRRHHPSNFLSALPIDGRKDPFLNWRFFFAFLYFCLASVGEAQEESSENGTLGSVETGGIPASETREFDPATYEAFGYRIGEIFSIDANLSAGEFEAVTRGLRRKWSDMGPPAGYDSASRISELLALMTEHRNRSESKLSALREETNRKNRAEGEAFFAQLDAEGATLKTEQGLHYMIIRKGTGGSPDRSKTVRFHLRGSRLNGETYVNTYEGKKPAVLPLQRLVPGLQDGLQLIGEGGKATLFVPPDLAYKDNGYGPIEPGETLTLEVELLEVLDGAPPGQPPGSTQQMPEEATRQIRAQANKYIDAIKKNREKKDATQ